ncbi:MAG: YegS/Rv2252/BmrU family lipid kinase [Bacteroidales bacterium]|nr:YegS/Rv2252/BmrU family lipid kinase [Bacteroidales bacterium]
MANRIKKERIVFIINPVSGTGRNRMMEPVIRELVDFNKYDIDIEFTGYRGHAAKLAKKYVKKGVDIIAAIGGDGTINEIGSALIHTQTALAIIPSGSGNGLARYLRIPLSTAEAVELINRKKIKSIDVGRMNKKYFFCTCGTGFDARVGEVFDKGKRRGFVNYVITAIREFFIYRPKNYLLKIDGHKYQERAFLITLANAGQYGNNAYISPGARIDDGLLDVCIIRPFPKYNMFSLGMRLFNRTMDQSKFVEVIRGRKIRIKRKKKNPGSFGW